MQIRSMCVIRVEFDLPASFADSVFGAGVGTTGRACSAPMMTRDTCASAKGLATGRECVAVPIRDS